MSNDLVSLKCRNPNVTLYVGGDNEWDGRLFYFERGSSSLVVQTPQFRQPGYTHYNSDPEADKQYVATFFFDLEKIATFVKNMVFGQTNWAYMVKNIKDGSYSLRYKERRMTPVSCPVWAPLVPETELFYTKYIGAEDREAIWNGQLVDCLIGWNDFWLDIVDRSMRGHRLLDGLDVTVEVLGHIVRNNEVIGLITEHYEDDRRVKYSDRAAVYAAVKKVQSRGLIISFCAGGISMHRGKVRLLDPQSVRKFSEVADPEEAVERYHWNTLAEIFKELRQHPNSVPPTRRCFHSDPVPLIPFPSPEKPLGTVSLYRMVRHTTLPGRQVGTRLGVPSKSALASLFYIYGSGLYTACSSLLIARCPVPDEDDEEVDSAVSRKTFPRTRTQTAESPISTQFSCLGRTRQRPYTRQRFLTAPE
ncbi:hypothetical protein B0H11DRAFT_2068395 [Mycena galericulata]|nr:hypothetical protein B0H11DRAFT_2073932 [Mycena galericulata]KAJ7454961.1 hypothetical protein B0H11DRAFT_2068395 [Mycena galericulata]